MDSEDFGLQLLRAIAAVLGLSKLPKVTLDQFQGDLESALADCVVVPASESASANGAPTASDLDETASNILSEIVDASATEGGIYISDLHSTSRLRPARLIYYLEVLAELGLITGKFINEEGVGQRLEWRYWGTKEGRRYLFEGGGE
jgi:hypothetical protein